MGCETVIPGEEIQKAIEALGPEGGVVQLKPATYVLTDTVWLRSHVTVRGAGMARTLVRLADGTNKPMFRSNFRIIEELHKTGGQFEEATLYCDKDGRPVEACHDVGLIDMTIDGNGANNPGDKDMLPFLTTLFEGTYNYRFENLHIKNSRGYAAIYANIFDYPRRTYRAGEPHQNYILNCVIEGTEPAMGCDDPGYGCGMFITSFGNDNVLIKGCKVFNNHHKTFKHYAAGICIEDQPNLVRIEDCECYDNGYHGIWLNETRNAVVVNCRSHHNGMSGIGIDGVYENFSVQNSIVGNLCYENAEDGIEQVVYAENQQGLRPSPLPAYTLVVGNRCWNNARKGIDLQAVSRSFIAHNYCFNKSGAARRQQVGLSIDAPDNTAVNNYCIDNDAEQTQLSEGNDVVPAGTLYALPGDDGVFLPGCTCVRKEPAWAPETIVGGF